MLISPYSVVSVNKDDESVQVILTREQVEHSPDIDTHQSVSRRLERDHASCDDYAIAGSDGDIGHVQDVLFDDEAWVVRYLVVDTRNWWPGGKKVVIATQWIDDISWVESAVRIRLTRDQIKSSPEYDEHKPLDRDFERRLHDHYERTGYWDL